MTRTDWSKERVLVTGGTGFLGKEVTLELERRGATVRAARTWHGDLRWRGVTQLLVNSRINGYRITRIIHLAAACGGIAANMDAPADFWRDNLLMGLNIIEAAARIDVHLTVVGTTCSYPKHCPTPFREETLFDGYPEETNAPYGIAKRALAVGLDAYHRQHGLQCAFIVPANLYGPDDNFDWRTSHVIPAMIRKYVEAADADAPTVKLWGTGTPTREFLYVNDCARGVVDASGRMDKPTPINLGTGREISIRQLAAQVADTVGFQGETVWDASKPDGQPRRRLSTDRARSMLGWCSAVDLADGLRETVEWWRANRERIEGEEVDHPQSAGKNGGA